jgi:hypothetical protein
MDKPEPISRDVVCSICGLDWGRHTEKTAEECIELLKADLAREKQNARPYLPMPYPLPYPVAPNPYPTTPTPWVQPRPWINPWRWSTTSSPPFTITANSVVQ